jgi:nicotinamidase-related amidase
MEPIDPHAFDEQQGGARPDAAGLVLQPDTALLLVVDVQEKLAKAMPPESMAQVERNTAVLVRAAVRLGLPVVASEQYPKGLGPTVEALRALLPEPPLHKMEFSCGNSRDIARRIFQTGRRQVIVAGMEAHVCVFQTVRDLQLGGYRSFVAQDAVCSRTSANREVGISLMEKAGATMTSTEAVLFDLLGVAGTPEFKELSPLIK